MISFRQIRRRRSAFVKLSIICFATVAVLFWFYQLQTVSNDEPIRENRLSYVFPRSNEDRDQKHISHKRIRQSALKAAPWIEKHSKNLSAFRNPALLHKLQAKGSNNLKAKVLKYSKTTKPTNAKIGGMPVMKVTPGLGEGGLPVHLSPEEEKLSDEVFNTAAFNVYLSDRISLNRTVPDPRNPK